MEEPDRDRVEEIFHEARKLPVDQRQAFVERAADGDPALIQTVLDLLKTHAPNNILDDRIDIGLRSISDKLEGQTIGERYFIERQLGDGGMSRVYVARDRNVNNRAVVIKVLSQELLEHPYALQKFEQEVEALLRINHAGVVDVFDKGILKDGRPYFVMQFINGGHLRPQIPANEGMNLERAASILRQLGAALNHVHENGVFHRDLKPENILLRRGTDSIVLIDFGIARVTDSAVAPTTTHGPSAGTLKYMSPEQLRGEQVTAASDIYSMAVIAYEMVTGRRPFNPNSEAELLDQQRKGVDLKPRALRRTLPPKAEKLILDALSFKPAARHQNAKQFGDSLANALIAAPVVPTIPWSKVIRAALVIMIGVMIFLGIYMFIYAPPPPTPNRSFNYSLTVQRMRDGQPYQQPFKSHGEETYVTGDQFQLTVSTPVPAYLYIFHESPPGQELTSFKLIFPRRSTNNGFAGLGADQSVQSDWIAFRGPAGAENFWFVWSTSPVTELDSATIEAFEDPEGGLTAQTLVAVREYLKTREAEIKPITYNYNANKNAVVRGKHDLLVSQAQFKHR